MCGVILQGDVEDLVQQNAGTLAGAKAAGDRDRAAGEGAVELKDAFTERFLQEKIGISTAHQIFHP